MHKINSLKEFRITTGLGQVEFAKKLGEDKGNYNKRENGNKGVGVITPAYIKKIKAAFPKTDKEILLRLFELSESDEPTGSTNQILSEDNISKMREQVKILKSAVSVLEDTLIESLLKL